jgi:hypothetical protein
VVALNPGPSETRGPTWAKGWRPGSLRSPSARRAAI